MKGLSFFHLIFRLFYQENFDIVQRFNMNVGNRTVLCMTENIIVINENNYFVPIEYV